ncbi:nitrate ABC transporter substrate-binding protein [Gloeocapsopsis sp. AAB1 = 1H9]|uniref:Nitrate ABC transporter substrate-binding protein n=2 Tax=Gloeocapsopsis TaxID=693222 RepID=A0A6N8FXV1_9CHRO|nr:nitrate ABC transporter substrate-binding protein [Gloeocapsopsis dulcis AAB1 = 1H9]
MTALPNTKSRKTYTLNSFMSRCSCGSFHTPEEHWKFMEGMPQDPVDLVADLIAMGQYKPETLKLTEKFTHAELRKALVQQMLAKAKPEQQQICNDLIKQAGGLEEAFAAAFGPHATGFFNDTLRASKFRRRDFLIKVAATAAIVTLASCARENSNTSQSSIGETSTPDNLEKTDLNIGFIPIACATPIVISEPLGFYQKHGLNVTLRKMPNWAAVRESAIAGELDAYHMLSPMPIAVTLGLGSTTFPIQLASIENINGQSIAVALKHRDRIQGPADFKGMTIAVPFPYSMHNLLLRYYLASGGLNPDTDVAIQIVPPPDSVAQMSAGQLDAFLMPDNFGQRAVFEGIGFIHMLTKDLWDGHPCCAFAASQQWIDAHPNTFRAVNKAIIDGAAHADAAENRTEIAKVLSERRYLNQPETVLQAVMTGNFENGLGNTLNVPDRVGFDPYPWKSFAKWISSQLVRWDLMPTEKADYAQIAEQIYMTDLARELAQELGQNPPNEETRVEKLKFDTFNPENPAAYLEQQSQKFNV